MDFLKKNYEKVLLGLVLAGLIGGLVFMLFYISSDQDEMRQKREGLVNPRVQALTNLDLTALGSVSARLQSSYNLDFETGNKVFNPFEWQRGLDGYPVKANRQTGVQMVVVTNIVPLYLIITLDAVATNELGARYTVGVEKQAATVPAKRRHQQHWVSAGDKANDTFAMVEVKGAPDNPENLVLKLVDTGELVTVSRDKPFRRVDGYMADFRYDPEKKVFRGKRAGDKVSFSGVDYLVIEVNQNELILADQSNQKKTPLPLTP